MPEDMRWTEMTADELLAAAQHAFDSTPPSANGLHRGLIHAQMLMQAAVIMAGREDV